MAGWMREQLHKPDEEGLSYIQRQEMAFQKGLEETEKEGLAKALLDLESIECPCACEPECPGETCKKSVAAKKAAQEKYDEVMAELYPERESATSKLATTKPTTSKPALKEPVQSKGPSTLTSKSAASLLSHPKSSTTAPKPKVQPTTTTTKPRLPFSHISSRKQAPPPTNPSPMRHTAAALASKTTIGRSAGRATSATYRKNAGPAAPKPVAEEAPDTSLPPAVYIARYGEPKVGSRMWDRCLEAGCLYGREQEEVPGLGGRSLEELLREGAEEEFVFEL